MATRTVSVGLLLSVGSYRRSARDAAAETRRLRDEVRDVSTAARDTAGEMRRAGEATERAAGGRVRARVRDLRGDLRSLRDAVRGVGQEATTTASRVGDVAGQDRAIRGLASRVRELRVRFRSAGRQAGDGLGEGLVDGADGRIRTGLPAAAEQAGQQAGERFGDAFRRTSDGRLRDVRGRFVRDIGDSGTAAGRVAGRALFGQLATFFQAVPPHAKTVLIGGLVSLAPFIAGVINGAVLAGLSAATVAGGVALAFGDPRVKAEVKSLGEELKSTLTEAAGAFVPATLHGVDIVRDEMRTIGPLLEEMFTASSGHVAPLVRTVTGLVREMLPGMTRALERSGPVLAGLERGAATFGRAIGDALDTMSTGATGAGLAVKDLLGMLAVGLQTLATSIAFLSKTYALMRGAFTTDKAGFVAELAAGEAASAEFKAGLEELIGAAAGYSSATGTATTSTRDFIAAQQEAAGQRRTLFEMETRWQEAIAQSTQLGKENSAGLKGNTAASRANRNALKAQADIAVELYRETLAQTNSQSAANRVARRSYAAFMAAADAMGVGKREADRLARSLGLIPPSRRVRIRSNAAQVEREAREARSALNGVARTYYASVNVRYHYSNDRGLKVDGGTLVRRYGGITEHARTGLLREAEMFSGGPTRYAFAEAGTGGEAFIPKFGDTARSLSILARAASWYGHTIAPRTAPAAAPMLAPTTGGTPSTGGVQTVRVVIDGTGVLTGLRREIFIQGGVVQTVLGR